MRISKTSCLVLTLIAGCSTENPGAAPHQDGAPPAADTGAVDTVAAPDQLPDAGPVEGDASDRFISIYIEGDTATPPPADGLAGQTPQDYRMGLGRFDLMRSAQDPAPVVAFDHGAQPVMVDMLKTTLGGKARIADLPAGAYTHGRVLLTMATFTVAATGHGAGLAVPGKVTVTAALSDTTIKGAPWKQNQAEFTGDFKPLPPVTIPAPLPPLPTTGGGSVVQEGGRTWLVFQLPEPLKVSPATDRDHRATIIYRVRESFRWQDQQKAGFAPKVFDIDMTGFEAVKSFGATGYAVETD
jgi:hypothetical protein